MIPVRYDHLVMRPHDPKNTRQPSAMKGSGRHWPKHGAQKPKEKK